MITEHFDYHSPSTLNEIFKLMEENDGAKILAGGHSLLPMMKIRFSDPAHLIDINGIDELKGITEVDGKIHIGAMTTENELINSDLLTQKVPIIVEAAKLIADPQVRNRGTIGGDIVHGDPGNDHPRSMMALDATFILADPNGERAVHANSFFLGTYWTELGENEILKEVQLPIPSENHGYSYTKFKRKTGDFATAATAVVLSLNGDVCSSINIVMTNVGPTAIKVEEAEALLIGKVIDDELINQAAQKAMEICNPIEDLRGNVAYKTHMAGEMTRKAIQTALSRATG